MKAAVFPFPEQVLSPEILPFLKFDDFHMLDTANSHLLFTNTCEHLLREDKFDFALMNVVKIAC
jgi:hypothetical protein